jgi:hypothetical protein
VSVAGDATPRNEAADRTGRTPDQPARGGEQTAAAGRPEPAVKDRPAAPAAADAESAPGPQQPAGETGGPKGPEPTRYGDWEKGGRCFDF